MDDYYGFNVMNFSDPLNPFGHGDGAGEGQEDFINGDGYSYDIWFEEFINGNGIDLTEDNASMIDLDELIFFR